MVCWFSVIPCFSIVSLFCVFRHFLFVSSLIPILFLFPLCLVLLASIRPFLLRWLFCLPSLCPFCHLPYLFGIGGGIGGTGGVCDIGGIGVPGPSAILISLVIAYLSRPWNTHGLPLVTVIRGASVVLVPSVTCDRGITPLRGHPCSHTLRHGPSIPVVSA